VKVVQIYVGDPSGAAADAGARASRFHEGPTPSRSLGPAARRLIDERGGVRGRMCDLLGDPLGGLGWTRWGLVPGA
jgi:hypothetical protein